MSPLFADERVTANDEVIDSIPANSAVARVNGLDWPQIGKELDEQGSCLLQGVLSPVECQALAALYAQDSIFRSRVVMGRHGFGRGEYKYFNYPLPELIQGLRSASSSGSGNAGRLSRQSPQWSKPCPVWATAHRWHHLPRCQLAGRTLARSTPSP